MKRILIEIDLSTSKVERRDLAERLISEAVCILATPAYASCLYSQISEAFLKIIFHFWALYQVN